MLTFYYGSYKVHIDHTGNTAYFRVDDQYRYARVEGKGWVATATPGAEIILLAGKMLQLVMTDVVWAEMRYATLRQELMIVTNDVESAERSESQAIRAGNSSRQAQSLLTVQLKKAEESLQQARAGG